jgi:hypothetical protein
MIARAVLVSALLALALGALVPEAGASPVEAAGPPGTTVAAASELSAPAVAECVAAHDDAGLLRRTDKWLDARAAMQRCADDACPIAIRSDCRTWLDELAAALPTLLVVVERDDDGRRPVRLELDGRSLELHEKHGPIEVTPGRHRLLLSLDGYPAVTVEVTLAKGEKNHVVRARFLRPKVTVPPPPVAPPRSRVSRPVPLATYLYGGGSLVAFATSAVLLGAALDAQANARDDCAPGCPKDRRESIDRRLLIADLVGIAGLGLGGMAVYSYVRRPWVTESGATRVHVAVAADRASLSLGGTF